MFYEKIPKRLINSCLIFFSFNNIILKTLVEKYKLSPTLVYSICNEVTNSGTSCQNDIRNGTLRISEETSRIAEKACQYLQNFKEIQKKIGGRKDVFMGCVGWIYMQPNVDSERLRVAIAQNYYNISPASKTENTMKEISAIYNKGYSKKNRRYFDYEWKTGGNK